MGLSWSKNAAVAPALAFCGLRHQRRGSSGTPRGQIRGTSASGACGGAARGHDRLATALYERPQARASAYLVEIRRSHSHSGNCMEHQLFESDATAAKGSAAGDKYGRTMATDRKKRSSFQKSTARRRSSLNLLCRRFTAAEREQLVHWVKTRTSPQRLVTRSRIVLLAGEGHSVAEIARRLAVTPATVRLWCERFHRRGVGALEKDAPGRGRRPGMDKRTVVAVLRAMSTPPAERVWTARTLAAAVGTSVSTVWRVWKRHHLTSSSAPDAIAHSLRKVISETLPKR